MDAGASWITYAPAVVGCVSGGAAARIETLTRPVGRSLTAQQRAPKLSIGGIHRAAHRGVVELGVTVTVDLPACLVGGVVARGLDVLVDGDSARRQLCR